MGLTFLSTYRLSLKLDACYNIGMCDGIDPEVQNEVDRH
jgi:hypothetical protein